MPIFWIALSYREYITTLTTSSSNSSGGGDLLVEFSSWSGLLEQDTC